MKKRILFTGGSGLLALNCAIYLRNDFDIYLGLHKRIISLEGVQTCELNLENEEELEFILKRIKPDILINTAGMTNVEECELNPQEAFKINSIIPGTLAKISKNLDIYFIHISTDHLFDGNKSLVTEFEPTCPLNIYGKSKEIGENEVLKNNKDALIVRTNFFGWGTSYRRSFSDTIYYSLMTEKKITLFEDVFYTPILIETLIEILLKLFSIDINGIINIVSNERITKYKFGILLAQVFGFDSNFILPSSISNNKKLVYRPKDMSLSNQKLLNLLQIPTLEKQMALLKKQEKTGNTFELIKL